MNRRLIPIIEGLPKSGTQMYIYSLPQSNLFAYRDQYGEYILFCHLSDFMRYEAGERVERIYLNESQLEEIERGYEYNSWFDIKTNFKSVV